MEELGWIAIHRKLLESVIFQSEKALKVWIWCLLSANYEKNTLLVGFKNVVIEKGQFMFGRITASEELKISQGTVWRWMLYLKDNNYIDIKSTNKYSIITILNWDKYQAKKTTKRTTTGHQTDNKRTTTGHKQQ